jgi:N-acetylmuramoyl-L-alanine amidase
MTIAECKDFVVVIDAGHGGHDHGAIGNITNEKSINLGVALELGKKLSEMDGVKVVYTRSNDTFVPLQGRADIANKAGGDLFVSIHTNSVDKNSKNRLTVAGASVYTLGFKKSQENLAVAMRENSVMKMESDYTTAYEGFDPNSVESYIIFEMSQNLHMEQSIKAANEVQKELVSAAGRKDHGVRQANFWVLFKTGMPAMLIELDFICNPTVEKFLDSKSGQKSLANAIYNGICAYKKDVDRDNAILNGHDIKPKPAPAQKSDKNIPEPITTKEKTDSKENIIYKIQFLTSPKKLENNSKAFKGLEPIEFYIDGSTYKYTYGAYESTKGASMDLKTVKKLFPDAFIVKTQNGKRIK